jgi:hypothetical protein
MTVRLNDNARDGYAVVWDVAAGDEGKTVTVYATGEEGDVHNKAAQPNTGRAGVFYPEGFTGSSEIKVREGDQDPEGAVYAEGTITLS